MRAFIYCLSITLSMAALAGCASARTARTPAAPIPYLEAHRLPTPSATVSVRPIESPAVPAGMIMTIPVRGPSALPALKPLDRIAAANKAAVQEPRSDGFISAIQVYPWMEGALYRLYAAPDRVTDIALQAGEGLIAISSGDTSRWIIGNTHSGVGSDQTVHILVKPQAPNLKTNLIIATDRRTYHLQMESTPATAMAALSWRYPQDELLAIQAAAKKAETVAPTVEGISLEALHFGYRVSGAAVSWRPLRVFDDGARVYIEFLANISTGEAPPLFIAGADGKAEIVNYRVSRNFYIVDRLFDVGELRLGAKPQAVVRIVSDRAAGGRHD